VSYAYCKAHASHFCPCCKPHLYRGEGDAEKIRGWAEIAPIVPIEQQAQPASPTLRWVRTLTWAEAEEATQEGLRREAMSSGQHKVYDPGKQMSTYQDVISCKGEKAVSLMTGLPWTGKGQQGLKRADVGDFYEVRTVDEAWKGLIFRPGDDPNRPFVLTLIVANGNDVQAMGWAWGGEVASDEYLQGASRMSSKKWWLMKPGQYHAMASLPRPQH